MNGPETVWIILFCVMSLLAFKRPAWGVGAYMISFFACPQFWWWGKDSIGLYRWNFYGGFILLAAVLVGRLANPVQTRFQSEPKLVKWIIGVLLAILVNATIVHAVLAPNRVMSATAYELLFKFVVLFFLIIAATRSVMDFRIVLLSILLCAGYIGYEVTINHRGKIHGNRLEGVGAPGAAGSNELASLMVTVMPLAGVFLLSNRRWEKLATLPIGGFLINVVLLCNSRGAFLASIGAGAVFLVTAPSKERSKAVAILALGALGTFMLMGDERIVQRFLTTFKSEEELDGSAASRLAYWKCGLKLIQDHPLGAGGRAFNRVLGPEYIRQYGGQDWDARSCHNGYINETCEWGIQGGLLRVTFLVLSMALMFQTSRRCSRNGDVMGALLGSAFISGTMAFMITSIFGDFIDNEWGYWMGALAVAYGRFYSERPAPAPAAGNVPPPVPQLVCLPRPRMQQALLDDAASPKLGA